MLRRHLDVLMLLVAMPAFAAANRGAPTSAAVQGRPYRLMQVESCPSADRRFGPIKDDVRGAVRGFHDTQTDTSYYVTGTGAKPPDITISTKVAGAGPHRDLAVQLTAFVRGREARNVAEAARNGPVRVTFVLNDSVTLYPASTTLGRLQGDSTSITLPLTVRLEGKDLFAVAAAQRIVMRTGLAAFLLTDERHELRALMRIVMCPRSMPGTR